MSLRVLQLNTLLTGGGTDDQCVRLAAGLRAAGVDARIAGPADREFAQVSRRLGVPVHDTGAEGPIKLRYIVTVARLIRRERIPLVHAHHGRDYWPAILAAAVSGCRPRIVLSRHLAKSPGSWPGRWLVLRLCHAMVACSHFVEHVLREGHADPGSPEAERHWRPPMKGDHRKIRVIYGGSDLREFQPLERSDPAVAAIRQQWGVAPHEFVFGVVGGYVLPRGKGQREFLAAAARVREQVPHARFVVLGRGNMEETLRADIERLGLKGVASLPGYTQSMPAAMNALDCLVHPQIGTEAMALVVIEAHACGVPVIASDLDGIPEAFALGGLGQLVPPEDVPALAAAMVSTAGQPVPTPALRHEIHQRVARRMALDRYAGEMLELYREVLAG